MPSCAYLHLIPPSCRIRRTSRRPDAHQCSDYEWMVKQSTCPNFPLGRLPASHRLLIYLLEACQTVRPHNTATYSVRSNAPLHLLRASLIWSNACGPTRPRKIGCSPIRPVPPECPMTASNRTRGTSSLTTTRPPCLRQGRSGRNGLRSTLPSHPLRTHVRGTPHNHPLAGVGSVTFACCLRAVSRAQSRSYLQSSVGCIPAPKPAFRPCQPCRTLNFSSAGCQHYHF